MLSIPSPGKKSAHPVESEQASRLSDALRLLLNHRWDVVIVDERHREPDAIDTYRILRNSFPEIPVLFLAEDPGGKICRQGRKEGVDAVIGREDLADPLLGHFLGSCIEARKCRDSLQRMLYTFEQLPVCILICDSEGSVDYANSRYSAFAGLDRFEMFAENVHERASRDGDPVARRVSDALSSGGLWEGEVELPSRDGEARWLFLAVSPIRNADGLVTHYVAIGEDISSHKKAEDQLRQSEEHFRTLVHNINEYIYSVVFEKGEPVSTYHSPKCSLITGYDEKEMGEKDDLWFTMIYDRDRKTVTRFIKQLTEGKKPSTIEHRIIRKDGTLRWVMNTGAVQTERDGSISRIHGFIFDITERKQMEEELRKLSRALDESPVSVLITDVTGTIEYVNPNLTKVMGYEAGELIGKNPRVLKTGRHPPEFYTSLWETILQGQTWNGEILNRTRDGSERWHYESISPLKNRRGEITHFIAVMEDITERKLAEEALRARNENMEKDLRLAQLIQRAFLPGKIPPQERIVADYRYLPLAGIGGDYFAVHPLEGKDLSVFIGDVAGHGVSAALFLSLVKSATDRIWRRHGDEPRSYIYALNKLLIEEMSTVFLTAVYGIFRHNGGGPIVFSFCNGGHPYPVHYRASDGEFLQFRQCGTIVGMINEGRYSATDVELERGDRIFLFTDGIPEASNEKRQIIGFDTGLLDLFRRAHRPDLGGTLDAVIKEVDAFKEGSEAEDDIVILGFEIK